MIWPLIAQVGATAIGLAGSARANNKMNDMIAAKERSINTLFNDEYSTDFLDTDQGASAHRSLKDMYDNQVKQADQSLASTGATSEAKIAARGEASKTYADQLNKLTGYGTSYRDNLRRDYQNQMNAMFNLQLQQQQGQQSSWGALIQNAGQLGGGLSELLGENTKK